MKRSVPSEFGRLDTRAYADLPGFELISAGLLDMAAGRETIEALLLRSASMRLSAVGIALTGSAPADISTRLYELVAAQVGEGRAHGRYNALCRRLASFLRAAQAVDAPAAMYTADI